MDSRIAGAICNYQVQYSLPFRVRHVISSWDGLCLCKNLKWTASVIRARTWSALSSYPPLPVGRSQQCRLGLCAKCFTKSIQQQRGYWTPLLCLLFSAPVNFPKYCLLHGTVVVLPHTPHRISRLYCIHHIWLWPKLVTSGKVIRADQAPRFAPWNTSL